MTSAGIGARADGGAGDAAAAAADALVELPPAGKSPAARADAVVAQQLEEECPRAGSGRREALSEANPMKG